jgi:hypothetical protein
MAVRQALLEACAQAAAGGRRRIGGAGPVTVDPCTTTMMIGEKCADLLQEVA